LEPRPAWTLIGYGKYLKTFAAGLKQRIVHSIRNAAVPHLPGGVGADGVRPLGRLAIAPVEAGLHT